MVENRLQYATVLPRGAPAPTLLDLVRPLFGSPVSLPDATKGKVTFTKRDATPCRMPDGIPDSLLKTDIHYRIRDGTQHGTGAHQPIPPEVAIDVEPHPSYFWANQHRQIAVSVGARLHHSKALPLRVLLCFTHDHFRCFKKAIPITPTKTFSQGGR